MKLSARRIAFMGLLLALSIILSLLESLIPPIPTLPPGIRLGLSNIVVMYALLNLSKLDTLLIVFVKAAFAGLTRGVTAGLMSLSGGIASALIMLLLLTLFKKRISLISLSLAGAIMHNVAQIVAAMFLMQSTAVIYYLPVLVIAGVVMGYVTGTILKIIMPAMSRLNKQMKGEVCGD